MPDVGSHVTEYGYVETPYGNFITRQDGDWGSGGRSDLFALWPNGTAERPAFINPDFQSSDAAFDPVGKRICFSTDAPIESGSEKAGDTNIWCADRVGDSWGEAYPLPAPVNSPYAEGSPSFANDGSLYFMSTRSEGFGMGDIYTARVNMGGDWHVSNLGPRINSETGEWNVGVRPDGQALIFEASHRATNRSVPGDLYYSEARETGWSNPVPLSRLNSPSSDLLARWTLNGTIHYASGDGLDRRVSVREAMTDDWRPVGSRVLAVSRSLGKVHLLDPHTLEETAHFPMAGGPHEIAASHDGRRAVIPFAGIYPEPHAEPVDKRPPFIRGDSLGFRLLDLDNGQGRTIPLEECVEPHGVTTDAQGSRFWITCSVEGEVLQIDGESGEIEDHIPFGTGVHKVEYLTARKALLAINPDQGSASLFNLSDKEMTSVQVGPGAEGLSVNRDGTKAWIARSSDGQLCRLDLVKLRLDWCRETDGQFSIAVAYVERHGEVWVSDLGSATLTIIDDATGSALSEIELPTGALDLAAAPDGRTVYASLPRHNAVIALDTENRTLRARFDGAVEVDDVDWLGP